MNYPTQLGKCPILESIFEIRFESELPEDAFFGVVYPRLKDKFDKFQKDSLIESFPSDLKEKGFTKFLFSYVSENDEYRLKLGNNILSIVKKRPYDSWTNFSKLINYVFNIYTEAGVIKSISRLGLRYIDFFASTTSIFENTRIKPAVGDTDLLMEKGFLQVIISSKYKDLKCNLIIAENVKINDEFGSVIDTDVSIKNPKIEDVPEVLNRMKDESKRIFFETISKEFLITLDPE